MRLHILSDLHLEGREFTLPEVNADVLVLAGDITTAKLGLSAVKKLIGDRQTVYVAGNHEYYYGKFPTQITKLVPNLSDTFHLLENNEVFIGGVRFLGCTLWTDFDLYTQVGRVPAMRDAEEWMNDYELVRFDETHGLPHFTGQESTRKLLPLDTRNWHLKSVEWLKHKLWDQKWEGKTVVVTHHLPSVKSVNSNYDADQLNPAFASDLDYLFPFVDLWIHGHTHTPCDYTVFHNEYSVLEKTRVICNPRGYRREDGNGFNPELVVEI